MKAFSASKETRRNLTIDILKGIGILFMVARHAYVPYTVPVSLFHMAIFFIASGYLYNEKNHSDFHHLKSFVIRRLKSIWLPYVLTTSAFILLNNIFISIGFYTVDPKFLKYDGMGVTSLAHKYSSVEMLILLVKGFFMKSFTQLSGALWFLHTLFWVMIVYAIISFFLKKFFKKQNPYLLWQGVISIIFLGIGYYCSLNGITLKNYNRMFTVYFLIYIGFLFRKFNLMESIANRSRIYSISTFVASLAILFLGFRSGKMISLSNNYIVNPVYFLFMSLAGWFFLYLLSDYLKIHTLLCKKALTYIGQNSIWIVCLHFLAFKFVNAAVVLSQNWDHYLIAAFPVLTNSGFWWAVYLVIGISFPLLLQYLYKMFRTRLMQLKKEIV